MIRYIVLICTLTVIDQISKLLAIKNLGSGNEVAVFPGLNLSLAYNDGAAFGILATQPGWQRWFFIGVAVIVIISVSIWIYNSLKAKDKLEVLCLSLILSGAIGNLIDRACYGYVVDFIDFYIQNWHWYTFNIADSLICVGAFVLALYYLFPKLKKKK